MCEWFTKIYINTLTQDKVGLIDCAKKLVKLKRNVVMKDEMNESVHRDYYNKNRSLIRLTPALVIESMLYYGTFKLTDGQDPEDDADEVYANQPNLKPVAMNIMSSRTMFWKARQIRFNESQAKFRNFNMTRQEVFEELFGKGGLVPFFETHQKLWEDAYTPGEDMASVYNRIRNDKLLLSKLLYTGQPQFAHHKFKVGDFTTYELGCQLKGANTIANRAYDNPFVFPVHPVPQKNVDLDRRMVRESAHPTASPKWFDTIYQNTDELYKLGLIKSGSKAIQDFKPEEMVKDERNSTAEVMYENPIHDFFRITPEVIIESLLYYGAIKLGVGQCGTLPTKEYLKGFTCIQTLACDIMLDERKYWSCRNLRCSEDRTVVAFTETSRELYTIVFGNFPLKQKGVIPFVDHHKALWEDILKESSGYHDLEKVYSAKWSTPQLIAQLCFTGSDKYKYHDIYVPGTKANERDHNKRYEKTTYVLGNELKALLKTKVTDPELLADWSRNPVVDEAAGEYHAKYCHDERIRLYLKDNPSRKVSKPFGRNGVAQLRTQHDIYMDQMRLENRNNPQPAAVAAANSPDYFDSIEWFQRMTGKTEEEWNKQDYGRQQWVDMGNGEWGIKHAKTGQVYSAGILHHKTLKELRSLYAQRPRPKGNPASIILINDDAETPLPKKKSNILEILFKPEIENHMFQAASQFNGLECGNDSTPCDSNTFLTDYVGDPTQGPFVSLAAAVAAVGRRDLMRKITKGPVPGWSQAIRKGEVTNDLNYLEALGDYFTVENGYVKNNSKSKALPKDSDERNKLAGLATVVYNQNAKIYLDIRKRFEFDFAMMPQPINVHQVFVAAMNIKQGVSGSLNRKDPDRENKILFLLRLAYESTYLAAYHVNAKVLWLTLVGCGAFGNQLTDVVDVINQVHSDLGHGLEVRLVDFEGKCVMRDGQVKVK